MLRYVGVRLSKCHFVNLITNLPACAEPRVPENSGKPYLADEIGYISARISHRYKQQNSIL